LAIQGGASAISEKIDEIDVKIMKILLKDSRKKFTDIAKECGVSVTTIKNRYSELKKSGIILGSTVIVNVKNLGYEGYLSLYVNAQFDEVEQFLEYANKLPGVMTYHVTLNENYNAHILLPVKNMQEIEQRKEQIKKHPSVIDVKANIWTEIISIPENLSLDSLQ
jgi:DNA-binding Lrp family transcriptional regulator